MSDADRSRLPGGRKRTVRAKATPDLAGEGGDLFVTEALKEPALLDGFDDPARYAVAGVAGGLRLIIVGGGMDDDG